MTICDFSADLRDVAMREGMRRENATRGCGSIAMEVKEERVAPWYTLEDSKDVTTVTGWAVSRRRARRCCVTLEERMSLVGNIPVEVVCPCLIQKSTGLFWDYSPYLIK